MTDKEMIDFIIQERLNQALVNAETVAEKEEKMVEAEKIISSLPEDQRVAIECYLSDFANAVELNEILFYKQGFTDGVKLIKILLKL